MAELTGLGAASPDGLGAVPPPGEPREINWGGAAIAVAGIVAIGALAYYLGTKRPEDSDEDEGDQIDAGPGWYIATAESQEDLDDDEVEEIGPFETKTEAEEERRRLDATHYTKIRKV
jgi:hypothetical protein